MIYRTSVLPPLVVACFAEFSPPLRMLQNHTFYTSYTAYIAYISPHIEHLAYAHYIPKSIPSTILVHTAVDLLV